MQVTVVFLARAGQIVGKHLAKLELPEKATIEDLIEEIGERSARDSTGASKKEDWCSLSLSMGNLLTGPATGLRMETEWCLLRRRWGLAKVITPHILCNYHFLSRRSRITLFYHHRPVSCSREARPHQSRSSVLHWPQASRERPALSRIPG